MKLVPTQVGAQPNKIKLLAGLLVTLVVVYFWNNSSPSVPAGAPPPPVTTAPRPGPVNPKAATSSPGPRVPSRGGVARTGEDFRPTLKLKEGTDLSRIDPAIKTDLLTKVQQVPAIGGTRSVFEFYTPPPPKIEVKITPQPVGPQQPVTAPPPAPPVKVAPPPPPPIPLKFYGYANAPRTGPRRAFFLENDEIYVAGENDLIRNRYKVIRIGVNSAVVEDTSNKHQETLPLIAEQAG